MARILDENFREHGYSENWTEIIDAGGSINENFSISSFTAGTTSPQTLYKYVCNTIADSAQARINYTLSSAISSFYLRTEFIIISAPSTDSAKFSLVQFSNSAPTTAFRLWVRYTNATGLHSYIAMNPSNASTQYSNIPLLINTYYRFECYYSTTAESCICKLNDTVVHNIKITASPEKNIKVFNFLDDVTGTAKRTIYFDNIRVNNIIGDVNNSWPSTSYDEPIREIDHLSTQRLIGMSL